jgi:hypothetical protein
VLPRFTIVLPNILLDRIAMAAELHYLNAATCQPPNKQLQRTVIRRRGDVASAPFHYALAPRFTRQRAAAELRR